MQKRLLDFLRCPECKSSFDLAAFKNDDNEVTLGILRCSMGHYYPVWKGIPRMLPDALMKHWSELIWVPNIKDHPFIKDIQEKNAATLQLKKYDKPTQVNFSNEWDHHDIGDNTWTMKLEDRVEWFFLWPLKKSKEDLKGKLLLDAGCGNGSQSVYYTTLGMEIIAVDVSTGLEKGYNFRKKYAGAIPEKVHFVQADLQKPPFDVNTFDIIHSAGVIHHTPNTKYTFEQLHPLLKKDGSMYIWLYKYEKFVTPLVNSMRFITTRLPAGLFELIANLMSYPFILFCWLVNILGIRKYVTPTRHEAALAIHDIFGAPYAHYHNYDEVAQWYEKAGIKKHWPCNDDRRGFGICGVKIEN